MEESEDHLITRRASAMLNALALVEPVIAIHGPRSVGKSTVLHHFAAQQHVEVIDLDDLQIRDAVSASPSASVAAARPLCIDEYQHVPDVLDALKARLNKEGSLPATAVLTGSTRQDAVPRTAQALTGRLHTFTLWPLSQGEINCVQEDLLLSLLDDPDRAVASHPLSRTTRAEYAEKIAAGGMPLALRRKGAARNRWFDDYVRTSIERDAAELSRVGQRRALAELLGRVAGQTAQVLNTTRISDGMQLARKTVDDYLRLLEDLFLISRLPAWGRTLTARSTARPKIHVLDSGLATRLLRLAPDKLASLDPAVLTDFGHLVETFAVGELRKQASWLDSAPTLGHWRTSDGDEVDLVLEADDGRVIGFEMKAGERVSKEGFRALRKLRNMLGDRFVAGIALSLGSRSYTYEDRLHVMPLDRLWQSNT